MNKKVFSLFFALIFIIIGNISAQENRGYVKSTFSVGTTILDLTEDYSENLAALAFDVDFVNIYGLTVGLHTLQAFNINIPPFSFVSFGIGYTFSSSNLSIGGKIMAVPYRNGGIGIDINGTYWINEYMGFTGIFNYYISLASIKWNNLSARIGISCKI